MRGVNSAHLPPLSRRGRQRASSQRARLLRRGPDGCEQALALARRARHRRRLVRRRPRRFRVHHSPGRPAGRRPMREPPCSVAPQLERSDEETLARRLVLQHLSSRGTGRSGQTGVRASGKSFWRGAAHRSQQLHAVYGLPPSWARAQAARVVLRAVGAVACRVARAGRSEPVRHCAPHQCRVHGRAQPLELASRRTVRVARASRIGCPADVVRAAGGSSVCAGRATRVGHSLDVSAESSAKIVRFYFLFGEQSHRWGPRRESVRGGVRGGGAEEKRTYVWASMGFSGFVQAGLHLL